MSQIFMAQFENGHVTYWGLHKSGAIHVSRDAKRVVFEFVGLFPPIGRNQQR